MLRLSQGIFCLISCFALYAQQPVFTHQQHFKVEDGLPQNYISGIVQDKDGFLWIGTRDGLARYDGRHFLIFRKEYADSTSLSSSVVTSILLDRNNLLWILYYNNDVDCFDPRTFKVLGRSNRTNIATKLKSSFPEPDFYLFDDEWYVLSRTTTRLTGVPNKGIAVFDRNFQNHKLYNKAGGFLSSDTVMAFTHDGSGNLWMVSPKGLQRSDKKRLRFETIEYKGFNLKFDSTVRAAIVCNSKGEVLVADEEKFIIYDPSTGKFRTVMLPPVPQDPTQEKRIVQRIQPVDDGSCYFIYDARLFKLESDRILNLWKSPLQDQFRATGFLIDRTNVFWYATNAGGLLKVDLNGFPITSSPYQHNFYADVLKTYGISNSLLPAASLAERWAYHFRYIYNDSGRLYFTLFNHANYNKVYYSEKDKIYTLPFPENEMAVFDGIDFEGAKGIWALDDFNKKLWYWKDDKSVPVGLKITSDKFKSAYRYVDLLIIDNDFWLSSEESGLYQIRNGKIINHFHQRSKGNPLSSDMLSDLCHDPFDKDKFWIGSLGGGLMLWDRKTGLSKVFTTTDGLPNNTIYGIVPDEIGNLWLSTNNGICRFNIKDHTTSVFSTADGLPGAEFNRFHHFKFPDGRIAFGGLDGYAVFDPRNFRKLQVGMPIQITRVDVNNQTQKFGYKGNYIRKSLAELQEIDLPYNRNNLTVEFSSLAFNKPEKIRYRYMLKGADKAWIESGNDNIARYTRLRPGQYELLINTSSAPGEWSSEIKKIAVNISAPPWATWWAYSIYTLIIATIVVWYWRYKTRLIRMKEQIAYEQKEAMRLKEMDEFKDRFFNNITHEFRTPLSLIIAPIEKLSRETGLPPHVKKALGGVNRNAEQLLTLINQLLDLSKIEAGKMPVHLAAGNIFEFTQRCVEGFQTSATEKNISLTTSLNNFEGYFLFDHEKFEKIIYNLLSNAIKFTSPGGKVKLNIGKAAEEHMENVLVLSVEDSGIGISRQNLSRIFERFYQVDSGRLRNYQGTGIGLSLVKDLVELMGGSIKVDSEPGRGTVFTCYLPVQPVEWRPTTQAQQLKETVVTEQVVITEPSKSLPLVLVAEDNPELSSFLVDSLSKSWRVITTSNGIDAWNQVLKELPEIVISDAMMPGRDGFELCELVKKDRRTAHIGFIMLTARAAHSSRMEGFEAGADEYITKPFHIDELEARVLNLLSYQQRIREHMQSQLLPVEPGATIPHVNDIFIAGLYKVIDENIDDPQLDVEFLAKSMTMSRSTLNRKLNALIGVAANELIRRYRLQKAASLLSAGYEVTQTAYTVGFSTPSYFSECFKQQYGKSPSEFMAFRQIDSKL